MRSRRLELLEARQAILFIMPNCRFNELWLQDQRFAKWVARDPNSVNSAL